MLLQCAFSVSLLFHRRASADTEMPLTLKVLDETTVRDLAQTQAGAAVMTPPEVVFESREPLSGALEVPRHALKQQY